MDRRFAAAANQEQQQQQDESGDQRKGSGDGDGGDADPFQPPHFSLSNVINGNNQTAPMPARAAVETEEGNFSSSSATSNQGREWSHSNPPPPEEVRETTAF